MKKTIRWFLFAALIFTPAFAVNARELTASGILSHTEARPGGEFHLALVLDIVEKGKFYSPDPGKYALAPTVEVSAGDLKAGEPVWPEPEPFEQDLAGEKVVQRGYKEMAVVVIPFSVPDGAEKRSYDVSVKISGQVCMPDSCLNVEDTVAVKFVVGDEAVANPQWKDEFVSALVRAARNDPSRPPSPETADLTILSGLGLALLAGLILNIMPCVLPVIPIRIMSLVKMAGESRRRMVTLGLAFAGGIILFFAAVAAANIVFRLAFEQIFTISGLFQYRAARVVLALIVIAVAANLFGAFVVTVPSKIAGMSSSPEKGGHMSSVGMGLMMAVLATPCSFAILAQAVAWAQYVSLWLGTIAIVLIGVGMAVPHALLAAFPSLIERLPKPGAWMEKLRVLMGFILLPVAIWLIFAGSRDSYPAWVAAYGVVLVLCLWIWGSWVRYDARPLRKILVRGSALALAIAAGILMLSPSGELAVAFEPYSEGAVEQARSEGRTVLVKFTSATCTSCVIVDRTVYSDPEVARELEKRKVVVLKADVTNAGSEASRLLKERFRGAPPLTVLLPPSGEPVRLDGKFSSAALIEKLDNLGRS
jgi:thiol:disulfide interchange protein DsbD